MKHTRDVSLQGPSSISRTSSQLLFSSRRSIMKNKRKHKHKKRVSEKKKARQEIKRLRRAERRTQRPESENESENVFRLSSELSQATVSDQNRSVRRHNHKSHQKKARELTISRFRQITLSEGSGDEADHQLSQPSLPVREEPKIPSSVSRSLRKQVNKLSHAFDASLTFNADDHETPNNTDS